MQRVWTVVLSVWAMLAIVAVLAWSHIRPCSAPSPAAPQTLVVKGATASSTSSSSSLARWCHRTRRRSTSGVAAMTARLERARFHAVGTTCDGGRDRRSADGRLARRALAAARDEVAACEAALSRFDAASDLSRLNAAGGAWTRVDRRLVEALRLALRAREDTGGRFDPTVLPALDAAGYDRSFELLVERPAAEAAGWRAGAAVEIEDEAGLVRLERGRRRRSRRHRQGLRGVAGARRDARRVADASRRPRRPRRRPRASRRDAGGRAVADRVADPRRPGATAGVLVLDSGGVATSGRDVRRFGPGGSLHHLIDPRRACRRRRGRSRSPSSRPTPPRPRRMPRRSASRRPPRRRARRCAPAHLGALHPARRRHAPARRAAARSRRGSSSRAA